MTKCSGRRWCAALSWPCAFCRPSALPWASFRSSTVSDASGLYNLSRNLGGAIGIALIDTIVFSRGPEHADRIIDLIKQRSGEGGADSRPHGRRPAGPAKIRWALWASWMSSSRRALPLAINEAWLMLAVITALALVVAAGHGADSSARAPQRCRPAVAARKFILIENMVNDLTALGPAPVFHKCGLAE